MGRDITPESGFILEVSKFAELLDNLDLDRVKSQVIPTYRDCMNSVLASDFLESWDTEESNEFKAEQQALMDKYTGELESANSMESVAKLIDGIVMQRLSDMDSEKEDQGYIDPYADPYRSISRDSEDGDYLDDSAQLIFIRCFCHSVFRLEPTEVCIFNDYRCNWNVPHRNALDKTSELLLALTQVPIQRVQSAFSPFPIWHAIGEKLIILGAVVVYSQVAFLIHSFVICSCKASDPPPLFPTLDITPFDPAPPNQGARSRARSVSKTADT